MAKQTSTKKEKHFIPNSERKALEQQSFMELLLISNKDVSSYFITNWRIKETDIREKLDYRIDKDEKLEYLKNEIKSIRDNTELDLLETSFSFLNKKVSEIKKIADDYKRNKNLILNALPNKEKEFLMKPLLFVLSKSVTKEYISDNEARAAIEQLKALTRYSKALEEITEREKPLDALFYYLFYLHYEKHYIKFLITLHDEIKNNERDINSNSTAIPLITDKIEWLGTQKELGELFVELKRKGWLNDINVNTLQQCFTNTNTIEQVLKPSQDNKTKENLYEGIFTPKYKPSFSEIKPKKTNNL